MKCPRDSRKKFDWFRCKKISQKLNYLNFKSEQSERYFSSCPVCFTTLRMSHAKNTLATSEKCEWKSGFSSALKEIPFISRFLYLPYQFTKTLHIFADNNKISAISDTTQCLIESL